MLIPNKYAIEEGKQAPEGTVEMACGVCNKKFAIPAEDMKTYSLMEKNVCEACGEAADKAEAAASVAAMKTSDAADTVSKALGK